MERGLCLIHTIAREPQFNIIHLKHTLQNQVVYEHVHLYRVEISPFPTSLY